MSGNSIISVNHDDDAPRQYVAGLLTDQAAEDFEQHLFECEACADEVERAMEIRAALTTRRVAGGGWRVGLAIAATLAAVALGLWQLRLHEPNLSPPPLRSGNVREITASGRLQGTTFTGQWNAVANARSYRVQIFNSVGEPIARTETGNTRFSAAIGAAGNGELRYWKVQALDDDRVVIASSPLLKIGR